MPPPLARPGPPPVKAPPPFPVVAPPKPASGAPSVPHVTVAAEVPEAAAPAGTEKIPSSRKKAVLLAALAAMLVLGGGGFFAWKKFLSAPPPAPVVTKPKAPTPAVKSAPAPAAVTPANPAPAQAGPATPSETLNTVAHAPVNAINKAKGAVAARDASGQSKVEPVLSGGDIANKAAAPDGTKAAPASGRPGAVTNLGPGLSASNTGEAGAELSPAFRAYVGNAKISSVIGGPSPKATINGRVIRPGEVVDGSLGIVLDGVDPDGRQLMFKDKSGVVLIRRY